MCKTRKPVQVTPLEKPSLELPPSPVMEALSSATSIVTSMTHYESTSDKSLVSLRTILNFFNKNKEDAATIRYTLISDLKNIEEELQRVKHAQELALIELTAKYIAIPPNNRMKIIKNEDNQRQCLVRISQINRQQETMKLLYNTLSRRRTLSA